MVEQHPLLNWDRHALWVLLPNILVLKSHLQRRKEGRGPQAGAAGLCLFVFLPDCSLAIVLAMEDVEHVVLALHDHSFGILVDVVALSLNRAWPD